jgi:hypothetical protein
MGAWGGAWQWRLVTWLGSLVGLCRAMSIAHGHHWPHTHRSTWIWAAPPWTGHLSLVRVSPPYKTMGRVRMITLHSAAFFNVTLPRCCMILNDLSTILQNSCFYKYISFMSWSVLRVPAEYLVYMIFNIIHMPLSLITSLLYIYTNW